MKKKTVIFALSTFIILVIVELIAVNRIDHMMNKDMMSGAISTISTQLEKIGLEETDEVYSELLGRSLTKEEIRQENIINLQHSLTIFSNVFYADDICLPDGSWILSDHVITARLYSESKEMLYVSVDSSELVKAYNDYANQSYTARTTDIKGRDIKNTFYYVVLDRFYLDGLRIIPEKASIYRIDQEEHNTERKSSVTLADSLTCETGNVDNLPCYELEEGQDTSSLTYLTKFKYMCASEQKETSLMIGLVSGQESSLTERREVLEKLVSGKHVSGKRDLIGIPEYHTTVIRQDSPYYGGEISIVLANKNVNYQLYKMLFIFVWIFLNINIVITVILTGLRALILHKKKR